MEWRGRRGWVDESKLMQGCFGGEGVFSSPDERLFRDHGGFRYLKPKYAGSWLDGVSASRSGIFCPFPIYCISKLPIFKNSPVSPPTKLPFYENGKFFNKVGWKPRLQPWGGLWRHGVCISPNMAAWLGEWVGKVWKRGKAALVTHILVSMLPMYLCIWLN